MSDMKQNYSLNDTTELRKLIVENPTLPVLIFCGEESWNGEYGYQQADVSRGEVERITLCGETWLNEEDYREHLSDQLWEADEYMSDEEFDKVLDKQMEETNFVEAITVYVG